MQYLDLTLPTLAANLALDEALLETAEEQHSDLEFLRLWESPQTMVVVGRSSRVQDEVNEAACRQERVPIFRRSSGGAAIVAGPGCLMYAIVLSYERRPALRDISRAHAFVLGRLSTSLAPLLNHVGTVSMAGTSDLVIVQGAGSREQGGRCVRSIRKFSGNSMRVKRTHLLYHGTLLYDFDLPLMERYLLAPPRQPGYRNARSHREFVMNVPASRRQLADAVRAAWSGTTELDEVPMSRVNELVATRFRSERWNYEFP
ncbi:MAG TPA: lipoate--protein ligase family protein [Lacipirellulaceae bacterium]|nr:lipoate--protein ligase family protein [Lacipirellulaceae bacterium]